MYPVFSFSTDEVDHDEVEDDMGENEVSEPSLWTYSGELGFVGWIHLKSETDSKHERRHAGNESGEESVEREGSNQAAVDELEHPSEEDASEIGIDNLEFLRGVVVILVIELGHDSRQGGHGDG
jgi:hypothetical protein